MKTLWAIALPLLGLGAWFAGVGDLLAATVLTVLTAHILAWYGNCRFTFRAILILSLIIASVSGGLSVLVWFVLKGKLLWITWGLGWSLVNSIMIMMQDNLRPGPQSSSKRSRNGNPA